LMQREMALVEHIASTLTAMFEQKLAVVESRSMAFTQQQTEMVANLVRESQAQAIPVAVEAAGRAAAQMLQDQSDRLARVHQEATGAAGVAVQAAGEAVRAAAHANVPRPEPALDMPMGGVVAPAPHQPVGLDGFLLQSILPGLPTFAGDDPLKEGMTAEHLINHLEAMRCLHPNMTDGQMITATTSRFKKASYAFNWWQNSIAGKAGAAFPFPTWADFKLAFSMAMRGPDQATAVRRQLNQLRMQGDELGSYVSQFRSLFIRLQTLNSPMSEPDAVYLFALGLSSRLKVHCPLKPSTTLSDAIDAVTEKHNRRQLMEYISDSKKERPRRSGRNFAAWEEGEGGWWDEDDQGGEEEAPEEVDDPDAELLAMDARARGRGRPGRGRGHGRGPARGQGSRGRGRGHQGGRGGRAGGGRGLPPEVEARRAARQCFRCGAADHWVRECPVPAPENERG